MGGRKMTEQDLEKINVLIANGLDDATVAQVTGWCRTTICRVRNGVRDQRVKGRVESSSYHTSQLAKLNDVLDRLDRLAERVELVDSILDNMAEQFDKMNAKLTELMPVRGYVADLIQKSNDKSNEKSNEKTPDVVKEKPKNGVDIKRTDGRVDGIPLKGLFRLQCPECKSIFMAGVDEGIKEYPCNCGHIIKFNNMAKIQFSCIKCDRNSKGWTNLTSDTLNIKCLCGQKMKFYWDEAKKEYN